LDNTKVNVTQQTNYPWEGNVKIKIEPEKEKNFTVCVRIPGWAVGKAVPSDLYSYIDKNPADISLYINGKPIGTKTHNGFAVIERKWSRGDTIELKLPMPVRRVIANEQVKDDLNKVALERGPLVYCVEGIDNDGKVFDLIIGDNLKFETEYKKELLGGITVISAEVSDKGGVKRRLTAVPYYAWSHRGPGQMAVWLPREQRAD
ncbi:MAG: glycoside hydrolase family 127 protein, partial [Phycisphaerae bacterium]